MESFDKALGGITFALAIVACAIIPCLFTMITVDVTMRELLVMRPPLFTQTVVEYGLLYIAMLSAPWLVRERGHVAIEALIAVLPRIIQRFLAFVVYLTCFLVSLLFTYFSAVIMYDYWAGGEIDTRSIDIPYWLQFLPMTIGFFFIALEFLMFLLGVRHYYSYDLGEVKDGV